MLKDDGGGSFDSCFTLRDVLGRGCSCAVHRGHDLQRGGEVACKLARRQPRMLWDKVVDTYEREADLLRRCAHPLSFYCPLRGSVKTAPFFSP